MPRKQRRSRKRRSRKGRKSRNRRRSRKMSMQVDAPEIYIPPGILIKHLHGCLSQEDMQALACASKTTRATSIEGNKQRYKDYMDNARKCRTTCCMLDGYVFYNPALVRASNADDMYKTMIFLPDRQISCTFPMSDFSFYSLAGVSINNFWGEIYSMEKRKLLGQLPPGYQMPPDYEAEQKLNATIAYTYYQLLYNILSMPEDPPLLYTPESPFSQVEEELTSISLQAKEKILNNIKASKGYAILLITAALDSVGMLQAAVRKLNRIDTGTDRRRINEKVADMETKTDGVRDEALSDYMDEDLYLDLLVARAIERDDGGMLDRLQKKNIAIGEWRSKQFVYIPLVVAFSRNKINAILSLIPHSEISKPQLYLAEKIQLIEMLAHPRDYAVPLLTKKVMAMYYQFKHSVNLETNTQTIVEQPFDTDTLKIFKKFVNKGYSFPGYKIISEIKIKSSLLVSLARLKLSSEITSEITLLTRFLQKIQTMLEQQQKKNLINQHDAHGDNILSYVLTRIVLPQLSGCQAQDKIKEDLQDFLKVLEEYGFKFNEEDEDMRTLLDSLQR